MSKQYNKAQKRTRRLRYEKRKRQTARTAASKKAGTAAPAAA